MQNAKPMATANVESNVENPTTPHNELAKLGNVISAREEDLAKLRNVIKAKEESLAIKSTLLAGMDEMVKAKNRRLRKVTKALNIKLEDTLAKYGLITCTNKQYEDQIGKLHVSLAEKDAMIAEKDALIESKEAVN